MLKKLKMTAVQVHVCAAILLMFAATASANESFYTQVQSYAGASAHVEIVVSESFTLDGLVNVPAPASGSGATLTIRSENPVAPVTLTRGIAGNLFTLASGRALVLRDIIIDGGGNGEFAEGNAGTLVRVNSGGTLTVNDGAVLRNNVNSGDGGGVHVANGGNLTINGGEIIGNTASRGGGAYATGANGRIDMHGGKISGNTSSDLDGGGVDLRGGGVFTMSNGEISGNTGRDGGAVNVTGANSRFTMSGGKISDNVATREGGGVAVYATQQGGFTMTGGEITGNTAATGGGIHKTNNGELELGGTAVVVDNTVTSGNVNNVNLPNNQYAAISSTTPPAAGMNVGITKTTNSGIFVQSGAAAGQEQYFRDDVAGRAIAFYNGALVMGSRFYYQVAAYATAQSDAVIVIEQDFTLDGLVAVPANANGATLTIRSANPNAPVILSRGISGSLFTLPANARLILENIIIDGDKNGNFADGGGALVRVNNNGTLTMNDGALLRNNVNSSHGGGVYVANGGNLTINGGEISNNVATLQGGGVYATGANAILTMSGGKISGNRSGGEGGGVCIPSSATFTMTSGEITDNIAGGAGGGVRIRPGSRFILEGGKISGNTASTDGGGISMGGQSFTMTGGQISGNTAATGGGGVRVSSGTFSMTGGEISGNTANGSSTSSFDGGGGVIIIDGMFVMTGGEITDNTANRGGGVYVSGGTSVAGTFIRAGGEISGNIIRFTEIPTIIVTWNKPAGDGPFIYDEGSTNDLTVQPSSATVFWSINNGFHGVRYQNGNNTGFAELPVTVIRDSFITRIMSYAEADEDVEVVVNENLTLGAPVNILTPRTEGITLTIRSADPNAPVTLTRGTLGHLFTVRENAALILENIIIDGDGDGNFANGGGTLVRVDYLGTLTMNNSTILRNNINSGADGGGVFVANDGDFIMNGGKITGNNARNGGGVFVANGGDFVMTGGKITGNTANTNPADGVRSQGLDFLMIGGVVTGTGMGTYGVILGTVAFSNDGNGMIIAWNKPEGDGPFNYNEGSTDDLTITAHPAATATAVWAVDGGILGVSYANGDNTGFIPINAMMPVSILSTDRVIPDVGIVDDVAVVVPVDNKITAQLTAGPNPVSRSSGVINFFWQGRQIDNASLTIFDASGNVVNRITCRGDRPRSPATSESATTVNTQDRRLIGTWDLTDARGRPVSEGTYLARGVVTMLGGSRERVSVIIGVR